MGSFLLSLVPFGDGAKGFDGYRRAPVPAGAEFETSIGGDEVVFHRSPDELPIIKDVGAVFRMRLGRTRFIGLFRIDNRIGRGVIHLDQFNGILGDGAAVGGDGGHPFARIAGQLVCQGPPLDAGRVQAAIERVSGCGQFGAFEDGVHSTTGEGF